MARRVEEQSYSCEVCGEEGLSDEEMRSHVLDVHLRGAVFCPFCGLEVEEMAAHVNSAHLDYLSPESEMLAFIDEEAEEERGSLSSQTPRPLNNNNNNNNMETLSGGGAAGRQWPSPARSALALDLKPRESLGSLATEQPCPLCHYRAPSVPALEQHINRQHFDLTSPSLQEDSQREADDRSPPSPLYSCPLCVLTFHNTPDLELHVNIEHKDVLSPAKPVQDLSHDKRALECPICCFSNFKSTEELAFHIDQHFNPKGVSPMTPDVSSDRLLAKEMEKIDKEVQRLREQHEFELLRAQYGMDNEGNFKEQSLTNMQRAVYSGELSVADYYERQIELKVAESHGIDDGSSCTKDIVELVSGASSSCQNVSRTLLCSKVDHYASTYGDRGWGCGYRNMQMMLSCLTHHTGYNEQLYRHWSTSGGGGTRGWAEGVSRSAMPSISRLQEHIQWAWAEGFDVQGAEQLGSLLVNTRKWIGATELVTFLSSLRIRCQLVDFHRPTSPNGTHPELFQWVHDYFLAYDDFKPPLYLQHQGHSRTIIGVEEMRGGGVNLLVLDPSHSPSQMSALRLTSTSASALSLLRKPLQSMKAKQYQIVAVAGIIHSDVEYQNSKVLRSVRVPPDRP